MYNFDLIEIFGISFVHLVEFIVLFQTELGNLIKFKIKENAAVFLKLLKVDFLKK